MSVQRLPNPDWLPTSQHSGTREDNAAFSATGTPTFGDLPYTDGTPLKDAADVPEGPSPRHLVDGKTPDQSGGWTMAKSGTWEH